MRVKFWIISVLLFAVFAGIPEAKGEVSASTLPITSVVKIFSADARNSNDPNAWEYIQGGSGFILDREKQYIITNSHVVLEPLTYGYFDKYIVCTVESESKPYDCSFLAKLIYSDVEQDLALLQVTEHIPGSPSKKFAVDFGLYPALDISKGRLPRIAESIKTLGFPLLGGDTITLSQGIVSGFITEKDGTVLAIKTDSNLISGISGGIAVDDQGVFVGIPNAYFSDEPGQNIGLIIPAPIVKKWVDEVIKKADSLGDAPRFHIPFPTTVANVKAKRNSATSVTLTWNPAISSNGIDHYVVTYDTQPFYPLPSVYQTYPNLTETTELTVTISRLDRSKTYYFSVIAVDKKGSTSEAWSSLATVILSNALNEKGPFPDVRTSHKNFYAIQYLKEDGIIKGYPEGTFRPSKTIIRAELVALVVKALGRTPDVQKYSNCFPDVGREWFAPAVCFAKEKKWVKGYSDGTFRPSQKITLAEALLILEQAYDLPSDKVFFPKSFPSKLQNKWYSAVLNLAFQFGIVDGQLSSFNPAEYISRGTTAEYLYRTIMVSSYKKSYSRELWKDETGRPLSVEDLFGIDNSTRTYLVTNKTNAVKNANVKSKFKIQKVNCKDSGEEPRECYLARISSEQNVKIISSSLDIVDGTLRIRQIESSVFQKPVIWSPPEPLAVTHNTVQYIRSRNPIEVREDIGSLFLFDGVKAITLLGHEKIATPSGEKYALKIKETSVLHGSYAYVSYSSREKITVLSESIVYYVKGIGQVKSSSASRYQNKYGDTFATVSKIEELM